MVLMCIYRYQISNFASKNKISSQLFQSRAFCVHQTSQGQFPSSFPLHNPCPETPWRVKAVDVVHLGGLTGSQEIY